MNDHRPAAGNFCGEQNSAYGLLWPLFFGSMTLRCAAEFFMLPAMIVGFFYQPVTLLHHASSLDCATIEDTLISADVVLLNLVESLAKVSFAKIRIL